MLQNSLFAMLNILDKLKPNSQLGGELIEPIGTNKTQNLTITKNDMFLLSYRVVFLE